MQTILGSGGAIGVELAKALIQYTDEIRLVSRKPFKVNETDFLFSGDVLNPNVLENAVRGSKIVYVTIGFKYNYKNWKEKWPKFVQNLLKIVCIFLFYMYS